MEKQAEDRLVGTLGGAVEALVRGGWTREDLVVLIDERLAEIEEYARDEEEVKNG